MTVVSTAPQRSSEVWSTSEAQAEVFWLAFRALPEAAQQAVRKRLLPEPEFPLVLVAELESWQAAAAEALMNFEAMIDETH